MNLIQGVLAVVLLAIVVPGVAQARRGVARPVQIQFDCFVGELPAGQIAEATWRVKIGKAYYDLQVMKLRVLSGNASPMRIIDALAPYKSLTFTLAGEKPDLQKLSAAAAGEKHQVTAYLRLDARMLMVSSVR